MKEKLITFFNGHVVPGVMNRSFTAGRGGYFITLLANEATGKKNTGRSAGK